MPLRKRLRSLLRPILGSAKPVPSRRLQGADVAIIVLNWNKRDVTIACLESLADAETGGASVWAVDNGSRDGSVEAIGARFPQVRIVSLPENRGYAGGNNAGIRAALDSGATAVLLLNNDTIVARDFLVPLLEVLNGDPRAAAASSGVMRLDSPDVLQEAWFEIYYGFGIVRRRGVNALPGEGYDQLRRVDAAIGCSLLIAADALARVGLLDEAYFAYHEEIDWCLRARKAGYHVYYQPYSRVYHHFSKSTDVPRPGRRRRAADGSLANPIPLQWNPVRTYLGARNAVRFIRNHGNIVRKVYFALSTLYNIPLELLAVVLDEEEERMLGKLGYRRALGLYCLHAVGGSGRGPFRFAEWLRALVYAVGGPEEARKNGLHIAHAFGARGLSALFFLSACSASRSL